MPHLQPARFLQFWHLRSNLFYLCFQIYIVVFRCSTTDPTQLKQSSDQCIAGILRKINTDVSSTCVYLTHNLQSLCHYRRSLCILRFCSLLFTVWLRRGRLILRFHNAHMIWQGFLGANLARWIMRQHNLDLDTQYTWNIDNIPVIQLFNTVNILRWEIRIVDQKVKVWNGNIEVENWLGKNQNENASSRHGKTRNTE